MQIGKYIFYVFDTLTDFHIEMALNSISKQNFTPMEFVIYNSSHSFDSERLLHRSIDVLGNKFRSYMVVPSCPETQTTLADIRCQLYWIGGADFYFMHKSDFYLGQGSIAQAQAHYKPEPFFVNFCKFDLRETVGEMLGLSMKSWNEILGLDGAFDVTPGSTSDFGVKYDKIGYRGWDGTMHFYNEAARRVIDMDTFCKLETVEANRQKGVDWLYGDTRFLALHMFHALPGGRGDVNKDALGHRY